jgi:hypothetical protein
VSSLEFPNEIFLATYAKETLINEWDTRSNQTSEGVHSLCWAGQEEEGLRKFERVVGENLWVV